MFRLPQIFKEAPLHTELPSHKPAKAIPPKALLPLSKPLTVDYGRVVAAPWDEPSEPAYRADYSVAITTSTCSPFHPAYAKR